MNKSKAREQYDILIEEYQALNLTEDTTDLVLENHHIVPTSLGGSNDPDNLVMLPLKTHWEVHKLLADVGTREMKFAFRMMCGLMQAKGVKVSAEDYEAAKKAVRDIGDSDETRAKKSACVQGEKHPLFGLYGEDNPNFGSTRSKEALINMSGENNPMWGLFGEAHPSWGNVHTPEAREKMSIAKSGSNHPNYDHTMYTFEHKDGDIFIGTPYNFRTRFRLFQSNLCRVMNGGAKSVKGWRLVGDKVLV